MQDVSLIFQSAMATSIAGMCTAAGYAPEEALGTVLTTLVIATFVVGVLIVAVGARARASQGCCTAQCSGHLTLYPVLKSRRRVMWSPVIGVFALGV